MPITRKLNEEREHNVVKKLIFIYKPYWLLFLVLLMLFATGAFVWLKFATPVYESTARILIKDEKKGVEEAKTVESLDGFSGKNIIENELEVIKSPSLIDQVVAGLHLYAPLYQERRLKTRSAYTTSPVAVIAANADSILSTKEKIKFLVYPKEKKVLIGKQAYPMNQFVSTPYGQLQFVPNPHFTREAEVTEGSDFYFELLPQRIVSDRINTGIIASSPNKLSSIIYLKYNDEVPQRAEDILNTLMSAYTNSTLNDKNGLTANTLNFIDERLKLLKYDLDSIERKTQQFKARNSAVDISTQGKLFLQNVSNNDQRLGEINMQLAVLNQVDKYVTTKNGGGGIVPSTMGINDPTLSELVNKLYNSELQYATIRKTTGDNHPMTEAVKEQINQLRPSIVENIQSQRRSLEASRSNLASTNNAFFSTIQGMPEKERQLIDIDRERGTKSQIYNFLLQKREETALSHASTVSNNKIINVARSSENPVSPKRKVVYLAALLLAALTGILIVSTKERLRGRVMFISDIEALTSHPVIGEISVESSKNPIVMAEGRRTLIAEQFRKIRATLGYLGVNAERKRILVTSSISGEGKSFVASNLALSLAIAGKKVALLDFDLNNPSLNNKLSISEHRGITEYLQGKCSVADIIMPTNNHPNLFLIPTGDLPANPAELIMSGRTEELLSYLDGEFDYLVLDVAPVAPVTDAYLLSPFCDATLYIVRHNYTPKLFIERIDDSNMVHMLKNIAIIFNGVDKRGFGVKNDGYGYERPASYGYVYDDKRKPKLLPGSDK